MKTVIRITKRPILMILCICLFVATAPLQAYASKKDNAEQKLTSLTLQCKSGNVKHRNISFSIYQVAELSDDGEYTAEADFEAACVDFDSEKWNGVPEELAAFADENKSKPVASGKTDSNGKAEFRDLVPGIYLVCSDSTCPFLIALPKLHKGKWNYKVTAYPKCEKTDYVLDEEKLPYTGVQWPLVIWLAIAGCVLCTAGIALKKRQ